MRIGRGDSGRDSGGWVGDWASGRVHSGGGRSSGQGGKPERGLPRRLPRLLLLVLLLPLPLVLARPSGPILGPMPSVAAQEPPAVDPAAADPAAVGTPEAPAPPTVAAPQPSFDGIRVQRDGQALPYSVWYRWPPLLVTTPDGGAWVFFTAQAHRDGGLDALRLYAARFDPSRGLWLPATALGGGDVQFGPAAAVDAAGTVHLVFSDRAADAADAFSTLLYTRTTTDGGWRAPTPVAPDPNAGHQMMPAAAFDAAGQFHVMWRDQRNATPEQRALSPAFGHVFASDLTGEQWSDPIQVSERPNPDLYAAWPQLVADGARLLAVWSVYRGTTAAELDAPATRVEWSRRPLAEPSGWAPAAALVDREQGEIGGSLVDLAADPRGGAVVTYSRVFKTGNASSTDVFLRQMPAGGTAWGPHLKLVTGDLGFFPSVAVAADGTVFVGFNFGRERRVEVGALALRPGAARVSPLSLPTGGEEGEQGRPSLAAAADGRLWLAYMHAAAGNPSIELRATRGVELPS